MKSIIYFLSLIISKSLIPTYKTNNYNLNVGQCISSLKHDMQYFPHKELNWSIYTPSVSISDPIGFHQKGLHNYKQIFSFIRLFKKLLINDVDITYTLKYIPESKKIIIIWYSKWYINKLKPLHLNAISYFYLNDTGYIYKHHIDRIFSDADLNPIKNLALILDWFDNDLKYAFKPETCEYIWDCEAPMDCCDFILFKTCCSNGLKIPNLLPNEPELIPIPIPIPPKDINHIL